MYGYEFVMGIDDGKEGLEVDKCDMWIGGVGDGMVVCE